MRACFAHFTAPWLTDPHAHCGARRRRGRRHDRLSAAAGRPRGRAPRTQSRSRLRRELGQRRHDRAGPFLRLVLAACADYPRRSRSCSKTRRCASGSPPIRGSTPGPGGFLKECTAAKARRNTLLKHRLAAYSQTVLDEVVADEAIDYDRNTRGILYFHRSQKALDGGVEHMKLLESDGQAIKVLDPRPGDRARAGPGPRRGEDRRRHPLPDRRDRAIAPNSPARSPPRSSNAAAQSSPARPSAGSRPTGDKVTQAVTDRGPFAGDAYVLALGAESPILARKLGLRSAHLSDQGLFADHSDRRSRSRRRRSPVSTSTISSPSRVSATACASPRPRNSPATTRATSRPTSPS